MLQYTQNLMTKYLLAELKGLHGRVCASINLYACSRTDTWEVFPEEKNQVDNTIEAEFHVYNRNDFRNLNSPLPVLTYTSTNWKVQFERWSLGSKKIEMRQQREHEWGCLMALTPLLGKIQEAAESTARTWQESTVAVAVDPEQNTKQQNSQGSNSKVWHRSWPNPDGRLKDIVFIYLFCVFLFLFFFHFLFFYYYY